MLDFFRRLIQTPLGLAGAVLTPARGFLVVLFFVLSLAGIEQAPYVGILAYLVLPAFFVVGLVLMPLGSWRERRRRRAQPDQPLPGCFRHAWVRG